MTETERILAEYERREREIEPARYAPTNTAQVFMRQARERITLRLLAAAGLLPLSDKRVLDVGCGSGEWLLDFERWGARRESLAGIDLILPRIRVARARLSWTEHDEGVPRPGADLHCGDASHLPWRAESFDVVVQSMMFSSILDERMRRACAAEMVRVLSGDGVVVWYDFVVRNPMNKHLRPVSSGELLELFPGFKARTARTTLLQPLARRIVPRSVLLAELLERIRPLNTHVLAILTREEAAP